MSVVLRPFQNDILDDVRGHLRAGVRRVLIQSATGSGKTVLSASMLGNASAKGKRCWFMVHRRELIKQSSRTFTLVGIDHGIVSAGFMQQRRKPVQVCSIPTMARRLDLFDAPDLIVWDEAHHIAASTWDAIFAAYPQSIHIGLSATPERLDGTGLDRHFEVMVKGPTIAELIEGGFLAPYRLLAPGGLNLDAVHTVAGDFNKKELAAALDNSTITGDAVSHYIKHAAGKRAVMFQVSVKRSIEAVQKFLDRGIPAEHVDGETDPAERDAAVLRFERGETMVLSNVDLFGEGFDVPAIEVVIDCAPTMSLGRAMQRWGRALRPCDGKAEALILDHAGNCKRFGLPDDDREWSLEGRKKKKGSKNGEASVKSCPMCFAAMVSYRPTCKHCGHVFTAQGREIEEVEGDLQEVDPNMIRLQKKQEQRQAQTEADLVALGRARGYKRPEAWARHLIIARRSKGIAA